MRDLVPLAALASLGSGVAILSTGWSDVGELGWLVLGIFVLLGILLVRVRQLPGSTANPSFVDTEEGFRLTWHRCVPPERGWALGGLVAAGHVLAGLGLLDKLDALGFGGAAAMFAALATVVLTWMLRGPPETALELVGHVVQVGGTKTVLHRPREQVSWQGAAVRLGELELPLPSEEPVVVAQALLERLHALPDLQGSADEVPAALRRDYNRATKEAP